MYVTNCRNSHRIDRNLEANMDAQYMSTMGSGLLARLLAYGAMAGVTAVVMFLSYWWALNYGLISFNENRKLTLKPKNLPPGSMGLPWVGHTFEWMKNQREFYDIRWRRHGEIYKTNLFGVPTVIVTTQEAAKKLIVSSADSLKGAAPVRMTDLLGPHFVVFEKGDMHSQVKKRLMKHLLPESVRALVPAIEELTLKHLSGWTSRSNIAFVDEIEKYTLDVGMLAMLGPLPPLSAAKVNEEFTELEKGLQSIPIDKPGFQFHQSMKARRRFMKEVHEIINARKKDPNSKRPKDILDSLTDDTDPLPKDVIEDNVLGLLFASDRTTAGLLSFTVKYLHDHPDILRGVKDEQEKIRSRKASGDPLSWEDLKDMVYSYQVMQESGRMSNVVSSQYRFVEKELLYKGYVIPKGWGFMSLQRQWHLDPQVFPDPTKFDPSRFQTPKQAFTPFGMGPHFCAGYELARVELLIFLHHFTTKFRWEVTKDGPPDIVMFPNPHARLPLKLTNL